MADLTNKLKNRARREEQRENFSAAIELYSRALRVSERGGAADVSLYNRIGDIYLRLDDVDSAVGYYERAILRYADQDLYTSAIALCNKVLRVQPSRISAHLQLGRLQLETGLMAESRVNYLRYATELLTRGQPDEAEAALEEYVVRTEDLNSALRFAGALVANDRGDEALSLLLRLRTRLESLEWDVAPLERPIAAIRGFDARPVTAETDAAAEASETAGTDAPTGAGADIGNIGDLEAELEAAVEAEPAPSGSSETSRAAEPPAAEPSVPEPASVEPTPAVQEAPVGESDEWPLEEAGAGLAADELEAPDRGAESGPPPAPTLAEPEASEVSEDDDRKPRVPPEVTEQVEVALETPDGRGDPEVEPAEPARQDTRLEPRRREVESAEIAEGAERPAADVEPEPGWSATEGVETAEAAEPVEPEPRRSALDGVELEEGDLRDAGDPRPTPGWSPTEGIEVGEALEPDAPTDGAEPPAVEPGEEAWLGAIDTVETASGPSAEQPELSSDGSREARGTTDAASVPVAGEGSEPSLAAEPAESSFEAPAASEAPEDEVTAPAARLDARPAHELPEGAVESATRGGDTAGLEERPEAPEAGTRLDAEGLESLPSTEEVESGSQREDGRAAADATAWSPEPEASEVLPETPFRTPTDPPLDADAADSVEPELPPGEPASEVELARRSLETGRELIERGELNRAIEELERAARSPVCFLEAYELLQECRAERDAKAEAAAEPASARESEPERAGVVEPEPWAEPEPTAEPDVQPQPVAGSDEEAEPEVVSEEAEAEPEVARPPAASEAEAVEAEAEEPWPDAEPESLPEVAVGPAERTRSSWLLSTARASAEEGEGDGIAAESVEQKADGGRPPDEPFRLWLSAASYDVLKRALEELERREELQRALCVVERMLELKPEETALHRVRIARAAELGRDDLLPEAYMELARLLEASGDLLAARGAYERVQELDPERPELADRLAGLGERLAESGLAITPSEPEFEEEDEAPDQAGIPTPDSGFGDDGSDEPLPEGQRPAVHVYRGVVQDLQDGPAGRTVAEVEPVGDGLEAAREGTVDFDVILAELKDQLAERVVDEPDSRSRTEVGERLMEMGLLDDAIRELQAAVRGPDAPLRAFELLGRAFVEKGQPRVAARLLEEALDRLSEHTAEERLLGVLYQLGVACQESEESDKALECYERIFSVDIDYRDVRDRMDACAA